MTQRPKLHPAILSGSLLGAGFLKPAPGTIGSLFSLPMVYWAFSYLDVVGLWVLVLAFCIITVLAAPTFERFYGKDPSAMVSDEAAGQILPFALLANLGYLPSISVLLAGFLFFRFFDILKPLGINKLQNYPSGWGILFDDLLAGLYAFFCVFILILLFY